MMQWYSFTSQSSSSEQEIHRPRLQTRPWLQSLLLLQSGLQKPSIHLTSLSQSSSPEHSGSPQIWVVGWQNNPWHWYYVNLVFMIPSESYRRTFNSILTMGNATIVDALFSFSTIKDGLAIRNLTWSLLTNALNVFAIIVVSAFLFLTLVLDTLFSLGKLSVNWNMTLDWILQFCNPDPLCIRVACKFH